MRAADFANFEALERLAADGEEQAIDAESSGGNQHQYNGDDQAKTSFVLAGCRCQG